MLPVVGFSLHSAHRHYAEVKLLTRDVECRYKFLQKWHLPDLDWKFTCSGKPAQHEVTLGRPDQISVHTRRTGTSFDDSISFVHTQVASVLHDSPCLCRYLQACALSCFAEQAAMVEAEDDRTLALQCNPAEKTELGSACRA